MKIYKNSAKIDLTLDDFLELLEEDALEEILAMLIDLDETGSINGDYDGDFMMTTYYITDPDELDEIMDAMEGEWDEWGDDIPVMTDDELDMVFGSNYINYDYAGEMGSLADELLMSNEDLRVRRITKRFEHIIM